MLARRPYEDLTGTERDNRAKIKIIDYARKNRMTQMVKQEDEEFLKNSDLESKKKRYIDIIDQYLVTLQQTFDYFDLLPGQGQGGPVIKFHNSDRIARFFDNYAKLEYFNQQLRDLIKSILKEIPVDDPFLKKLKNKNEKLIEKYKMYFDFFNPRIEGGIPVTPFKISNMTVKKETVDERLYLIITQMEMLIHDNNDMILYLESTPRSGQGRKKYNIDTTEYIIPST